MGIARARQLAAIGAALVLLGAGAVLATRDDAPSVSLSSGGSGNADASLPDVAAEPTTTIATTPPTTAAPVTPTTARRGAPTVVAHEKTGDLPAGTVLSGESAIAGVVRNQSGQPVSNACVTVWVGGDGPHPPAMDVRTGADGVFAGAFEMTSFRDWANVHVRDCSGAVPGFARQLVHVMAYPAQTHSVPVTVQPGSALRGVVLDAATRTPVVGRCVGVSMNPISTAWVRTDSSGRWVIPDLPLGRFGVSLMTPAEPACGFGNGATSSSPYDGEITQPGSVEDIELLVPA